MFVFEGIDDEDQYYWFRATGDMVHYIAHLIQSGQLNYENISPLMHSKTIRVKLLNGENYKFKLSSMYHLYLENAETGDMNISVYYEQHSYVPSWYRVSNYLLSSITLSTWKRIFSGKPPKRAIDEYGDKFQKNLLERELTMYEIMRWDRNKPPSDIGISANIFKPKPPPVEDEINSDSCNEYSSEEEILEDNIQEEFYEEIYE